MMIDAGARSPSPSDSPTLTGQLAAAELHSGEVLAGRFRIDAMLGVGGMGVVYRAHDLSLDVDVALKLLRPELARRPEAFERFRQELLLARQVSSPHVVRIHDIAQQDGRWFISMDFVDGESLERRMDLRGKIDPEEALAITRGLLEGLSAAHLRGVVHRDLKPANVLLDGQGQPYITDFGVARSLGATGGMTQSGVIFGTPEYLSPEQARGEKVDARSDLYAIGLILYEMLSGTLPFRGGTPAETVMQRIVRQPPSLAQVRADLPRWMQVFCDRLLKLNPAHRFASARDALQALETRRVPRLPLNRVALLSALLGVALVAGAIELARRYPPATPTVVPGEPRAGRIAVLPLSAPADDAESHAIARAIDEHLRNWLRGDASIAVVPRARSIDALARIVPDAKVLEPESLQRQLPDIMRAANAAVLVHGGVRRENRQLVLDLQADGDSAHKPAPLHVGAVDGAGLFAAYRSAAPQWLATLAHPGAAPDLPADAALAAGRAWLALDRDDAQSAAKEFASIADAAKNPLLAAVLLDAQQRAGEDLPAQNTGETIIKTFGSDASPPAREAHARALAANDQADAAVRVLDDALKSYPHDNELALLEADTLSANGDDKRALGVLRTLVKADDQNARAWFLLGRSAIKLGDAQAAVDDYLVRALILNTRAGNEAAVAETDNAIGVGYERLGQLDAAADQYTRAATLREKLGDNPGLAKSLRNLAIVQAERGDRAAAEQVLNRVKALLEALGDRASLADLYNDRGVVAEERGDFAEALKNYREALAMRQQLDLPALVAESLNNVGYCAYQMGDFDNASVYWLQALAAFEKLDDQTRVLHVNQSMALLDIARGHFVTARERLDASLRQAEDHQLPEESAVANVSLADLDLIEGRLAQAQASSARARQIFERRSDQRGQGEAMLQQARVALAAGAAARVDEVLAAIVADKLNIEQRAEYFIIRAQRAALGGDYTVANAQLDAATKTAAEASGGTLRLRIAIERARLDLTHGKLAAAIGELADLRKQTTALGDVPLRLDLLQLELAAALRSGNRAEAVACYHAALILLKGSGRFRDAALFHLLGQHAMSGADAAAAVAAATVARKQLLDDAPGEWRDDLSRWLDRRIGEELGSGHGS